MGLRWVTNTLFEPHEHVSPDLMLSPGIHDETVEVVAICPLAQVAVVNGAADVVNITHRRVRKHNRRDVRSSVRAGWR